jgi:hypothetical protein
MQHRIFGFLFICLFLPEILISQACNNEGYLLKESIIPQNSSSFWFPDHTEIQGVANDGLNWFVVTTDLTSQTGSDIDNGSMWRIPKNISLSSNSNSTEVISISMEEVSILANGNYTHWGDPDHYNYQGTDYIVVPIYDDDNNSDGIIACFQASNLEFRSFATLTERPGFCAVDNEGNIYTKKSNSSLVKYEVDWNSLTSSLGIVNALSNPTEIQLLFPGQNYSEIISWQGGEFTNSGESFYLSSGTAGGCFPFPGEGCGLFDRKLGPGEPRPSDGIHMFNTQSWAEIIKSSKSTSPENHFSFRFDNDLTGEQPQGLTIWNLDGENVADNVDGQLHIFLFDFDFSILDSGDHEFSMFHYTNIVNVDADSNNIPPLNDIGTKSIPFKTFNDAFNHYPIWSGAEIRLKAGNYNDTGRYDECVLITSEGGSAILGQ